MGTSADWPQPKPSQPTGEQVNDQSGEDQKNVDEPEPIAPPAADATESSANLATTRVVNTVSPAPAEPLPRWAQATEHDQKRDTRREELSRKIEERRKSHQRELRNLRIKTWSVLGVPIVAVLIGVGILLSNLFPVGTPVPGPLGGTPIDGISCDALEQTQTHYHAHLQIDVNGAAVPIPGDVGRQSLAQCYYWLHVHSDAGDEGVIHIESPNNTTYTLKQFFDIWGQQLSTTNVLGHKVDASHQLTAYVYAPTDQPTDDTQPFTVTPPSTLPPYTGDLTQIVLKPHELMVLEYGTPLVSPQSFTFLVGE